MDHGGMESSQELLPVCVCLPIQPEDKRQQQQSNARKKKRSPNQLDALESSHLRKQVGHDARWRSAGQLLIQSLKFVRELVVIDSQAMEHGCVEVSHRDRVFHHVVAVVICFAER